MVGPGEVDHLKVKNLHLEVGRVPEHDGELDTSKGSSLDPRVNPKEWSPTWVEVLPQDPHVIEGVGIEDIEAAPAVHHYLCEPCLSDDGANDEWEAAQTGDVSRVVLMAKGHCYFRPAKALWRRPAHHVDPS